jgi:hypothetical protein
MAQNRRSLRALAALLPAGALGLSVSLAAVDVKATASPDGGLDKPGSVAERLKAIREQVSGAIEQSADDGSNFAMDPETKLAWWNGWHNWGNGWHNWGNGGWHNWGNGWHNGWHNW